MAVGRSPRRCYRRINKAMQEILETRVMLCALHDVGPVVDERPDLVGVSNPSEVLEPADIVWVNRATTTAGGTGDTDSFGARFGTSAPLARAVVDAVIVAYERMIGSFDYSSAGIKYNLTLSMSSAGSGFGAGAGSLGLFGGKPRSGSISMGAGTSTADPNDTNNWFMDPTPFESSEFQGAIVNAFAGDAQSGSPAAGKGDFYTVVAAEMTHLMGLFGSATTGWTARTTNTGIADTSEGGGVGTFWVFQGPSIKHLLTSNNGGPPGQNYGSAVHGAGPDVPVSFGEDIYLGSQDQGNAMYEFGRRYMVNYAFALMFKDAYGYASVNPAQFSTGTMYSSRNQTTNNVLVRGTAGVTDNVSITRSGDTITISVDPASDAPGTGALPGAGDLPAWVTNYNISEVSSITIQTGSGNDTITIGANVGLPITLNAGTAADVDVLNVVGTASNEVIAFSNGVITSGSTSITSISGVESYNFDGAGGTDSLTLNGGASADSFTIAAGAFSGTLNGTYAAIESLVVQSAGGSDTVSLNAPSIPVSVDSGDGSDIINLIETLVGVDATILPSINGNVDSININSDSSGSASARFASDQSVGTVALAAGGTLTGGGVVTVAGSMNWSGGSMTDTGRTVIASGASLSMPGSGLRFSDRAIEINGNATMNPGGAMVLRVSDLTLGAGAWLNLADNSMIFDYTAASPIDAVDAMLTSGYSAGAWTSGGINSSVAAASSGRSIGFAEASEIFTAFPGTFAGQSVDDTTVVVRFTTNGDATLNGSTDASDFNVLASNFGTSGVRWSQGDFTFDNECNSADFNLLAANFGTALSATAGRGGNALPGGGGSSGSIFAGGRGAGDDDDSALI